MTQKVENEMSANSRMPAAGSIRDPRYDILFESIQIGPVLARNRFYQVPHCNGAGHRYPNTVAHMRGVKAEGGWAVVCTEFCSLHPVGDPSPAGHARLWNDDDVRDNALVVDAIHKHGALAGCETVITGVYSKNRESREIAISPSIRPSPAGDLPSHTRALSKSDIREVRKWHKDGVLRAKQAGFDVVYVYAAHGVSLLHDFLSPRINQRTDEYGGKLENRIRLLREVLQETKDVVGDKCAVAIRFSLDDFLGNEGLSKEEARDAMAMLAEEPDLWDLTGGHLDFPSSRFTQENWLEPWLTFVQSVTTKPVVAIGRFTSPDTMASMVKRGLMDFVGAARPSIADPFLPKKIEEGRLDDIRECIGCNICIATHFLATPIRCTQNPTMMEEWRRNWHPEKVNIARSNTTILVVGGGPAGLEATQFLGKRGYQVILAEAGKELGGHLIAVTKLPGLGEWMRVRDYRASQIKQLSNVQVYYESKLDAVQVRDFGFDHIALAVGSQWRRDGIGQRHATAIPGAELKCVFTPDDILSGRTMEGPVVVFDDDHYYMGGALAEMLAVRGLEVTLVTPAPLVSSWTVNTFDQTKIQARLLDLGVSIATNQDLETITNRSVVLRCVFTGRKIEQPSVSVVLITSRLGNEELYTELVGPDEIVPNNLRSLTRIGDCLSPSTLAQTIYSGHRFARELEESDSIIFKTERLYLDNSS